MKCRKQLVLTGYRVRFVDLREPKPRQPREQVYVADRQWLDALGLIGRNISATIRERFESAGYRVYSVEAIGPKRMAEIDLCRLWEAVAMEDHTGEEESTHGEGKACTV